jgi:hypothetical protein
MRNRMRAGRNGELGAQSLEWIGLGGFVLSAMAAATAYANGHLGDQLGRALIQHIQKALGG